MNLGVMPKNGSYLGPAHRFLAGLYAVQLLIPAYLIFDSLRAVFAHESGATEEYVIVMASAWLLVAAGAWALARDRERFLRRMSGPLMTVYSLLVLAVLFELVIRFECERVNRAPLFFKPGTKIVVNLRPWRMPGTAPTATFTINQLGLRGPMPPAPSELHDGRRLYKIIAIGGSTTECGALDDSKAWPQLLMESLNERQNQVRVWVNNAGVSGLTTVDHLSCLRRLPILSQADALIFLIGANDVEAALEFDGAPTQRALEKRAQLFAEHAPPGVPVAGSVLKRFWLFTVVRQAVLNGGARIKRWWRGPAHAPQTDGQADLRAAGPILPIPDLTVNLREYAQRVRALERECGAHHLRCVYLTQPSIYRSDLSPQDERLLWMGRIGHAGNIIGYARPGDLQIAMKAFNDTLLDVCRDDHLECYDLASAIPKDTSAFYDDEHFNIGGGRMVADFVAGRLLSTSPFCPQHPSVR